MFSTPFNNSFQIPQNFIKNKILIDTTFSRQLIKFCSWAGGFKAKGKYAKNKKNPGKESFSFFLSVPPRPRPPRQSIKTIYKPVSQLRETNIEGNSHRTKRMLSFTPKTFF
ncbi:hypothetical protein EO92_04130 [Methanosarcina sp. 2.H.A.1B.4]|nr:hypothetical protein EO92_04130 [Methanosarcina sp. 2.H.A.1B.4]